MAPDADGGLTLRGEGLAVMVPAAAVSAPSPSGLGGCPGPGVLIALESPTAVFLARPARLGWRPVLFATLAVVGDHEERARLNGQFGLTAQLGRLSWSVDGPDRRVTWAERSLVVSARGSRLAGPVVIRLCLAQHRADGLVLSPVRGAGLGRSVVAVVSGGEDLPGLAGRRRGMLLSGVHLVVRPARRPSRVLSAGPTAAPASADAF